MIFDVVQSEGRILLDVEKPVPCCLTLSPKEAIALAAMLLNAAMDANDEGGGGEGRRS